MDDRDRLLDERGGPLLGLLLRLTNQHWGDAIDAALQAAGFGDIRPPHANVFPFVPPEGIQVSELAQHARVRKQTMAQSVEQLERAGYVERRPDPEDRRGRLVFLTPRGEAVRPVCIAAGLRAEERWAQLTSAEEVETLRGILQRLLAALRTGADGGERALPGAVGIGRPGYDRAFHDRDGRTGHE